MKKTKITIKVRFGFNDFVCHKLNQEKKYLVLSYQINCDGQVSYGCSDSTGSWIWFKDYELDLYRSPKQVGINLNIECDNG